MAKKNTSRNTMGRAHSKRHYCEECGKPLNEYEYENYGDLCEKCYEHFLE